MLNQLGTAGRVEEIMRIEGRVLNVVVDRPMQIIGSRLADQVDVQSQVGPVLRGVVSALHLHFGDHVRTWAARAPA